MEEHIEHKNQNFAYFLECADGSYYAGWTNDLERRLKAHNSGIGGKYTRSRLPVKLVYWEAFSEKEDAMKREAQFKRMTRERKEKLVKGFQTHEPGVGVLGKIGDKSNENG